MSEKILQFLFTWSVLFVGWYCVTSFLLWDIHPYKDHLFEKYFLTRIFAFVTFLLVLIMVEDEG